jgi:Na+/glutamate symporter
MKLLLIEFCLVVCISVSYTLVKTNCSIWLELPMFALCIFFTVLLFLTLTKEVQ